MQALTKNKLSDLQHVLSFNHRMKVHRREDKISTRVYIVVTVRRLESWHSLINADPSFLRKIVKIPVADSAAELRYCEYGCPSGVVAAYERHYERLEVLEWWRRG